MPAEDTNAVTSEEDTPAQVDDTQYNEEDNTKEPVEENEKENEQTT